MNNFVKSMAAGLLAVMMTTSLVAFAPQKIETERPETQEEQVEAASIPVIEKTKPVEDVQVKESTPNTKVVILPRIDDFIITPAEANDELDVEIVEEIYEINSDEVADGELKNYESPQPVEVAAEWVSQGTYCITAYCACSYCCGKSDGITATGTYATQGRTIAVDPYIIPFGTEVLINGNVYIAEDCGGFGGHQIDMYFDSHDAALEWGVQYAEIFLKG